MRHGLALWLSRCLITSLLLTAGTSAQDWKGFFDRADSLAAEQDFDRAIAIMDSLIRIVEPAPADTAIATAYLRRGEWSGQKGNFAEAEASYREVLEISRAVHGPSDPRIGACLNLLGKACLRQGKADEAELLFTEAAGLFDEIKDDGWLAEEVTAVKGLAQIRVGGNRFGEAEPLLKHCVRMYQALGHDYDSQRAAILNNLAGIYIYLGEYAEAEPLLERALPIMEGSLGPRHRSVVDVTYNLAIVKERLGNDAVAEQYFARALESWRDIYEPGDPALVDGIKAMANICLKLGRYEESREFFEEAIGIVTDKLGPKHRTVATCLRDMARLQQALGNFDEAERLLDSTTAIQETTLGPEHPGLARSFMDLSSLCLTQGKLSRADSLLSRGLEITTSFWGPDHPRVATCLELFSRYHRLAGQPQAGLEFAGRAFTIRHQHLTGNAESLPEATALTLSWYARRAADLYISTLSDAGFADTSLWQAGAEIMLTAKGQVSDEIFRRWSCLSTVFDSTILAIAEARKKAAAQLSLLYFNESGRVRGGSYRDKLDSLSELVRSLERDLARLSPEYRARESEQHLNAAAIAAALPTGAVVVEYVRYDYRHADAESSDPHYLALVIAREGIRKLVDLGSAVEIDSLVAAYRRHFQEVASIWPDLTEQTLDEFNNVTGALSQIVWLPLEQVVGDASLLLLAPDGALNLISFAGLRNSGGRYLVEQQPLHLLSATRDLLRLSPESVSTRGLLALGNPDYEASVAERLTGDRAANRSAGAESLRNRQVSPLPYTEREVKKITAGWEARGGGAAVLLLGADASEENFKQQAPGKTAIHLATHGFFETEPPSGATRGNPLLRSGLLLAGANLWREDSTAVETDDGILTASEIAAMNLADTRWVVLSACESGLGQLQTGEGVYGLRRAFQMAGARTVISSLWPIPDKEAVRVMEYLYGSEDANLPVAMRNMSLTEIEKTAAQDLPDHPFIWAAFVALGDWRVDFK